MIHAVMEMHFPVMKHRYFNNKIFNNDAFVNTLQKEITRQENLDVFSCSEVIGRLDDFSTLQ